MKSGHTLQELAIELDRQRQLKKDYIVPDPMVEYRTESGVSHMMVQGGKVGAFTVDRLAQKQIAEKLGIPLKYFERMRDEQPGLLDTNVNTWLHTSNERRMLRTLDTRVRAVLSDRYRRLDNWDLAEFVLPVIRDLAEARVESCDLTETRLYIKVVTPRVQVEARVGDVLQAGVVISNSEVGLGGVTVQPLVFRLVCKNGLIAHDRSLRKTHIGRIAGSESEDPYELYQMDTLAADDHAFFLKVRDAVRGAVSEATFKVIAAKLAGMMGIPLEADPARTVKVLADRHDLADDERSSVLRHLIKNGDLSGYGLVNAVTEAAQHVESYDRSTELEMLGGQLIELDEGEWHVLAAA